MTAAVPIAPQTLSFDNPLTFSGGYYHISMNNANNNDHILNTKNYDLSRNYGSKKRSMPDEKTLQVRGPSGHTPVPDARARSSPEMEDKGATPDLADEDGRKKRSRGRPRLDTKDETAADRRRTQIRLAQRAYRHRKDTTITTLEKRVKELQKANEEMSRGFGDFYNILMSERVLDSAPHTFQRLSAIANRITTVAEKARSSPGEGSVSEESDEHTISERGSHSGLHSTTSTAVTMPQSSGFHSSFPQQSSIGRAPSRSSGVLRSTEATTPGPPSGPLIHVPTSLNYEVVTAATPDNATFPFYSSMEPTSGDNIDGHLAGGHSPYPSITPPSSYASHELTFGRRLQRQSIEQGLRLIMMSNPPPDRFAAVFGFCLFFESKEAIIKRLQLSLTRSQFEDLNNWRVPFTNLGGAGTFYPMQPSTEGSDRTSKNMPIGNQGSRSYGKPQETTGQSMGPFGPEVEATRDERIDRKMRMLWPGFEGEFFDPDEVETYLRQLGIFIPQRAEYVEADIDMSDLDRDDGSTRGDGSSASMPNAQQPQQPQQPRMANGDSAYGSSNHSGAWTASSNSPASGAADAAGAAAIIHMTQQSMMGMGGHSHRSTPAEYDDGMSNFMLPVGNNGMWTQSMNWPAKSKIALNVSVLIQELANNSVCLGRSPGIRRKDVNLAVKIAAGLVAASS